MKLSRRDAESGLQHWPRSDQRDGKCLTLLYAHNYAYVVPIIKWGNTIQEELDQGWSRTIDHDLTTEFDGLGMTVEFPIDIDCSYQQGKYDEHGVARHGYAVDARSSILHGKHGRITAIASASNRPTDSQRTQ